MANCVILVGEVVKPPSPLATSNRNEVFTKVRLRVTDEAGAVSSVVAMFFGADARRCLDLDLDPGELISVRASLKHGKNRLFAVGDFVERGKNENLTIAASRAGMAAAPRSDRRAEREEGQVPW